MPVTRYGFSSAPTYSTTFHNTFHSQIRQPIRHSNHIHFLDSRRMIPPTSPSFRPKDFRLNARRSLERAFQSVTLSFYSSKIQFINVSQTFMAYLCLFKYTIKSSRSEHFFRCPHATKGVVSVSNKPSHRIFR